MMITLKNPNRLRDIRVNMKKLSGATVDLLKSTGAVTDDASGLNFCLAAYQDSELANATQSTGTIKLSGDWLLELDGQLNPSPFTLSELELHLQQYNIQMTNTVIPESEFIEVNFSSLTAARNRIRLIKTSTSKIQGTVDSTISIKDSYLDFYVGGIPPFVCTPSAINGISEEIFTWGNRHLGLAYSINDGPIKTICYGSTGSTSQTPIEALLWVAHRPNYGLNENDTELFTTLLENFYVGRSSIEGVTGIDEAIDATKIVLYPFSEDWENYPGELDVFKKLFGEEVTEPQTLWSCAKVQLIEEELTDLKVGDSFDLKGINIQDPRYGRTLVNTPAGFYGDLTRTLDRDDGFDGTTAVEMIDNDTLRFTITEEGRGPYWILSANNTFTVSVKRAERGPGITCAGATRDATMALYLDTELAAGLDGAQLQGLMMQVKITVNDQTIDASAEDSHLFDVTVLETVDLEGLPPTWMFISATKMTNIHPVDTRITIDGTVGKGVLRIILLEDNPTHLNSEDYTLSQVCLAAAELPECTPNTVAIHTNPLGSDVANVTAPSLTYSIDDGEVYTISGTGMSGLATMTPLQALVKALQSSTDEFDDTPEAVLLHTLTHGFDFNPATATELVGNSAQTSKSTGAVIRFYKGDGTEEYDLFPALFNTESDEVLLSTCHVHTTASAPIQAPFEDTYTNNLSDSRVTLWIEDRYWETYQLEITQSGESLNGEIVKVTIKDFINGQGVDFGQHDIVTTQDSVSFKVTDFPESVWWLRLNSVKPVKVEVVHPTP